MVERPLRVYEEMDPRLLNLANNTRDLFLADGTLPGNVKLLLVMVLDGVHGASDGIQALAR